MAQHLDPAVLNELTDWAERHHVEMSCTSDKIPGEPVRGADGRLYTNNIPGDMHIRIDVAAR